MTVGEVFLGAFLQVLFERVARVISAFARHESMDKKLKRWKKTLLLIQAYINDAEAKQLTDNAVKVWLDELRDLAYDSDDLLDEIYTQAQIQKLKGVEGISGMFQDFASGISGMFGDNMESKIEEILVRLEDTAKNGNELNLSTNVGGSSSQWNRDPSTSLVEPHVYGRDEDKEAICKLMMNNHENVSVISIVGMGGIGKTTLAQLIYNDKDIVAGFDMKVWVCISEEFDMFAATKTIFHSVTKESGESKDLNMLQEKIQETFSNKKFLLILDDVWNTDYVKWNAFVRPFNVGLPGSKIFVTTRDDKVAKVVRSDLSHHLRILSDADCLALLVQHALGRNNFDKDPHLKGIGEELARKCKGLPLAAKALGGVLRSKGTKGEDWRDVLNSKIWDLPEEKNILPVLRLSYHHLLPHLKNLFAYCSIFPKDYEFDKFELVQLWMAEGFLAQRKGETKEQNGFGCFDELLSRSFFQRLSNNSSCFVMHDLVNDLAQFVAGDICYKMDEKVETDDEYEIPEKARHASFLRHEYEVFKKFNGFYKVKGLRTFLPMSVKDASRSHLSSKILLDLLPNLHRSRVLSLRGYSISEVPDSICKLIHLRYLNLSRTRIVSLPDSMKDLYNLEILSIRDCHVISKLPSTMGNLVNLRHLDNSNTDELKELPVELGGLKSLQSLPEIVLSKVGGLGIRDLGNLELLRGTVALSELQNVSNVGDARVANMRSKEIEELQLMWGGTLDDSRDSQLEQRVLDALQPNNEKLKKLGIKFYGGVQLPSWIGDPSFSKVFSVKLTSCFECTSLPPLGLLPELKHLEIENMPKIKRIGVEFFGRPDVGVPFPKLEDLELNNLPEWEEWSGSPDELRMEFPSLHQLTIYGCPKLAPVSALGLPVLRSLKIDDCSMVVLESLCELGFLKDLRVASVAGLRHLSKKLVQSMTNLEILEFCDCYELVSVGPHGAVIQHLSSLRNLTVKNCKLFVGDKEQQLPHNLEILELTECESLSLLPNDLRNLRELKISKCHRISNFPERAIPPMLKRLEIEECNGLESLPSDIYTLERLEIKRCDGITNFPERAIPPMLKRLVIEECNGLESLPSDISTLERLDIWKCPSLRNWSAGNFPSGLRNLDIYCCDELEAVPAGMFPPNINLSLDTLEITEWEKGSSLVQNVHNFSRLTKLKLCYIDALEYFPDQGLPPNLRELYVYGCSNLRSLPAQIQDMPSIQSIWIDNCCKLKPLSQWGLHQLTSLREFSIGSGFEELELLADFRHGNLFPSSLIELRIVGFRKLRSVSRVLDNLTSLRYLSFLYCESLNDLPSENILEKLWILNIEGSTLLKQRCSRDKGDYWPVIAGIPCVKETIQWCK